MKCLLIVLCFALNTITFAQTVAPTLKKQDAKPVCAEYATNLDFYDAIRFIPYVEITGHVKENDSMITVYKEGKILLLKEMVLISKSKVPENFRQSFEGKLWAIFYIKCIINNEPANILLMAEPIEKRKK
jgi:hypothetical protein